MENIQAQRGLKFRRDESVEITIATNAGACFGVVRAVKLGNQAIEKAQASTEPLFSLGPLIHNPMVVDDLAARGLKAVAGEDGVASGSTVVLRSHGIRKEIEARLKENGVKVIDATCPLVKKPQRIAQGLADKGYFLVLVGDAQHPEVIGVLSYYGKPTYLVAKFPADLDRIPADVEKVGIVAQTTIELAMLEAIIDAARARFSDVVIHNTICDATSVRQREAVLLAESAEVVVVVGGKNSSNTNKLVKICRDRQPNTYHIEDVGELDPNWFRNKRKIGVTGGASTPHEYVDLAGRRIAEMIVG